MSLRVLSSKLLLFFAFLKVYSADEYGELGADAFKKEARRANICIAIEEIVSMKPESLRDSIANLVKK